MKSSKTFGTLCLAFACAVFSFSLAVCARAQTVDFITQFSGGQGSASGVVQATDGNFYGGAGGGANGLGQIFRMTPEGKITTIYSFCSLSGCADGAYPGPAPILGMDGNLYGVTDGGGGNPSSTFYKVTLDGQLTTLYTFLRYFVPRWSVCERHRPGQRWQFLRHDRSQRKWQRRHDLSDQPNRAVQAALHILFTCKMRRRLDSLLPASPEQRRELLRYDLRRRSRRRRRGV